jgi:hypothetical protein
VNFSASLLQLNGPAGRLDALAERARDRVGELSNASGSAFKASDQVFARLDEKRREIEGRIDEALADARQRMSAATDEWAREDLRIVIRSTEELRDDVGGAYRLAGERAAETVRTIVENFSRTAAMELADVPLSSGVALQMAQGQSKLARDALGKVRAAGFEVESVGLDSIPLADRQVLIDRLAERGLEDIADRQRLGPVSLGMSPAQIDVAARARPDDATTARMQQDYLVRTLQPLQGQILNDANTALAANPDDPRAIVDAANAAKGYAELAARLRDVREELDQTSKAYKDFALSVRESLDANVGDAIGDLIRGTGSLKDALLGFANDIVDAFSRLAADQVLQGLIGNLGQPQKNGEVGQGGGLLGGALGSVLGSVFGAGGGGAKAFAVGGVADKPTLALFGEKSQEAFVPMRAGKIPLGVTTTGQLFARLPGNRRIPASLDGGRIKTFASGGAWANGITPTNRKWTAENVPTPTYDPTNQAGDIFVVADIDEAVQHGFVKGRDQLVNLMARDILKGGKLSKVVRR